MISILWSRPPRSSQVSLGASASSKSTLATLIARFADPDAAAVHIGGVDRRDMGEFALYSTVFFVLQDAQLLAATVRETCGTTWRRCTGGSGQDLPASESTSVGRRGLPARASASSSLTAASRCPP